MTKPSDEITAEEFEKLFQLNFMGVVYGTLCALKIMQRQGYGHIINTASLGGLLPAPFQAAYVASKAAVIGMTRCLALEYHDSGIYFSHLSPANVATNIFTAETRHQLEEKGLSEEEIRKRLSALKPPSNAISLDEALDYSLEKIAARETDIIVGDQARELYALFCRDHAAYNELALDLGRKRRVFYDALRRGEQAEFPG